MSIVGKMQLRTGLWGQGSTLTWKGNTNGREQKESVVEMRWQRRLVGWAAGHTWQVTRLHGKGMMNLDSDFLRLATFREYTINGGQQSWMACTTTRYRSQFSGSTFRGSTMRNSQEWH